MSLPWMLLLQLGRPRCCRRQATAARLVAQLQVVKGSSGVYMMYPGPAANGFIMGVGGGGHQFGILWCWVVALVTGGSALGGAMQLLSPALDPRLVPNLGLGAAIRVAGG